ncbi:MAG: RecX family transcriptional regulator [Acidobacteriota bacterium]
MADRGFEKEAVARALVRLEAEGLLDDLGAARSAVRIRGDRYGSRRLERELRARGFSRETVERALSEREPEAEETALYRALERVWKRSARLSGLVRRKRALDSLVRRGFPAAKVSEMIDRFEKTRNDDHEGKRGPRAVS